MLRGPLGAEINIKHFILDSIMIDRHQKQNDIMKTFYLYLS